MFEGVNGRTGAAGMGGAAVAQSVGAPRAEGNASSAGVSGTISAGGGAPVSKDVSTDPKFGEILQQIQAKYGAKPAKPREIKKTLGKDDFLRIMVMQMKHQDPTSPFKADQMAAQMAQFASVEQLQNMNQNITKMASQGNPMERLAMTNLIGKRVTVDKERFPHIEGQNEALSFVLPKNAKSVNLMIVAENGETVYQKDLGSQKAGEVAFTWDGLQSNTIPTKSGTYMFRVEAKDEQENTINTNAQSTARVVGVSFEGSDPVFLIGDSRRQEKVTLRNIIRIDDDGAMTGARSAPSLPAAPETADAPAQKPANLFTFQKGVGSSNLNPDSMTPEASAAIQKFLQEKNSAQNAQQNPAQSAAQNAYAQQQRVSADSGERGFPNGLHDNEEKGGEK